MQNRLRYSRERSLQSFVEGPYLHLAWNAYSQPRWYADADVLAVVALVSYASGGTPLGPVSDLVPPRPGPA